MRKSMVFIAVCLAASVLSAATDVTVWRAGLRCGVIDGAATLNETDWPDEAHTFAEPALGPAAATVRVTNAANPPADDPLSVLWAKKRTIVYWGEMWFDGKCYRIASLMMDPVLVKIDGEEVFRQKNGMRNNNQNDYPSTSDLLMPSRGWHAVEFRFHARDNQNAGPTCATDFDRGWDATHGFGIATTGASGNSFLGFEYPYPEDDGTGSLFRYDAGAEATSNLTYDHETVAYENHTLVFAAGEGGSVSSAGGTCAANEYVEVTATPDSGYRFVRWEGDVAEGQTFDHSPLFGIPGNRDRSLTAVFEPDVALSEKTFSGANGGKWSADGNWTPGGAPGPSDAVVIPNGKNVELDVFADVGSLTLEGNACLSANFASGKITTRQRTALDQTSTATIGLDIRGDLTLGGTSKLYLGGYRQASAARLAVKGNLTLNGTAAELAVYAGPTNGTDRAYQAFQRGGAKVVVGGKTTVASGCWIYPFSHNDTACGSTADSPKYNTGNPVIFDLRDLEVAAGGGFNADGLGYAKRYCDAPTCSHTMNAATVPNDADSSGGGYGGRGGSKSPSTPELGIRAYGYPMAPFYPGIAGGGEGIVGGGAIRIYAANVILDGTLSAMSATGDHNLGSGGGIWLTCDYFDGDGGVLTADSRYHAYKYYRISDYSNPRGGGGGGRIAIGMALSPYDIDQLYARGATDSYVAGSVEDILGPGVATMSAKASTGNYRTAYADGEDGSAVMYAAVPRGWGLLTIVVPSWAAKVEGFYPGLYPLSPDSNNIQGESAPEMLVSADGTHRASCEGYWISSTSGTSSGTGNTVCESYFVTTPTRLNWIYGEDEYRADCSALGDAGAEVACDWTAVGGTFTITATSDDETKEFQYWLGDVPFAQRFQNPLVVPAQAGFKAVAFFGNKAENAATYTSRDADAIDWFTATDWTPNGIPGTNDTANVKGVGNSRGMVAPAYVAVKDLVVDKCYCFIGGTRGLYNGPANLSRSARVDINLPRHSAYDPERLEPIGMDVFGDVTIKNNGCLYFGGMDQNSPLKVKIGGRLDVQGGFIVPTAGYDLHEIPTRDAAQYIEIPKLDYLYGENVFEVVGKTTLASGGWMRPICDNRSGVPVRFVMSDVEVAAGGGFDAREGGFERSYYLGTRQYYSCPGGMASGDNKAGGSYAGLGGGTKPDTTTTYIMTYGFENAPIYPGSASGTNRDGHRGAGMIRIDADSLTLDGTLTAVPTMSGQKGCSAGGGILVNVGTFTPGANCLVAVDGGQGKDGSGGGAGRAAICVGLEPEQMTNLAVSVDHVAEGATITPLADYLGSHFSCAGGLASTTASYSNGQPGTGVYIVNTAGQVTLTVAGNPSNIGIVEPVYGLATYDNGASVEASAPTGAPVSDDGLSRRVNEGWVLTAEDGTEIDRGEGTNATFALTANMVLTWNWTKLEHAVAVEATAGGAVTTNAIGDATSVWQEDGTEISLTVVPDAGFVFVGWTGDVPVENRFAATLAFPADRGRNIRALFSPATAGERIWVGAGTEEAPGGDGRSWDDPANWSPAGMPGVREAVTIPAGATVVASNGVPVEVGSLTVATGATLTVCGSAFTTHTMWPEDAVESDYYPSILKVNGDLSVAGRLNVGRRDSMSEPTLAVAGSMTVLSNGVLSVFAGYKDLSWETKDGWWQGGGTVTVGGLTAIRNGGWIHPWCNGLKGAPVVFRLNRLVIEPDAGIDAVSKGWDYSFMGVAQTIVQYGPAVQSGNNYTGASHAGLGGVSSAHAGLNETIYGDPLAPYMPGCTARITQFPSNGGGAIRILATGSVICRGEINADGGATYCTDSGAGSGGGVWICCSRMKIYETGSVTARGGDTYRNSSYSPSSGIGGAGGGGRVCICERLSAEDVRELFETGATTNPALAVEDLVADAAAYAKRVGAGTVSATGGLSRDGATGGPGGDGTVRWVSGPKPATQIMIK